MTRDELISILHTEGKTLGADMPLAEWTLAAEAFSAVEHMTPDCVTNAFQAWRRGEGEKNPLWATIWPKPEQIAHLAQPFWLQETARQYRERREREGMRTFTAEERAAERQKMIDAGYLNADGTPNLVLKARGMPMAPRPQQSQHELAEALRASAGQARGFGAPISQKHVDDPGDVV